MLCVKPRHFIWNKIISRSDANGPSWSLGSAHLSTTSWVHEPSWANELVSFYLFLLFKILNFLDFFFHIFYMGAKPRSAPARAHPKTSSSCPWAELWWAKTTNYSDLSSPLVSRYRYLESVAQVAKLLWS